MSILSLSPSTFKEAAGESWKTTLQQEETTSLLNYFQTVDISPPSHEKPCLYNPKPLERSPFRSSSPTQSLESHARWSRDWSISHNENLPFRDYLYGAVIKFEEIELGTTIAKHLATMAQRRRQSKLGQRVSIFWTIEPEANNKCHINLTIAVRKGATISQAEVEKLLGRMIDGLPIMRKPWVGLLRNGKTWVDYTLKHCATKPFLLFKSGALNRYAGYWGQFFERTPKQLRKEYWARYWKGIDLVGLYSPEKKPSTCF